MALIVWIFSTAWGLTNYYSVICMSSDCRRNLEKGLFFVHIEYLEIKKKVCYVTEKLEWTKIKLPLLGKRGKKDLEGRIESTDIGDSFHKRWIKKNYTQLHTISTCFCHIMSLLVLDGVEVESLWIALKTLCMYINLADPLL